MKKKLLIVSNLPSKNTKILLDEVETGAKSINAKDLEIVAHNAINVDYELISESSAIIIGTTENLGYMSGIIKDFFDRNYYKCLDKTNGLPHAIYIRAGHDGTGSEINLKKIITGLKWKEIQKPLILKGVWRNDFKKECFNLGATIAAGLDANIY